MMADPEPTPEPETPNDPPPTNSPEPEPTPKSSAPEPKLSDPEPEPEPSPPPTPTWPEDWRDRLGGKDAQFRKRLDRFASPEGIVKSWRSLEQKLSSGEYQKTMPDGTDENALAEWRKESGVPETAEGYYETLPKELDVSDEDRRVLDGVFKTAYDGGVPADKAGKMVEAYYEAQAAEAERILEEDRTARNEGEDILRSEWGPEYRANLNLLQTLFATHAPEGTKEMLFTSRTDEGRLLGDNPEVLKFLVNMAREVHPGAVVTPGSGLNQMQDVEKRIGEIERSMGDSKGKDPNGYWNNPHMQSEYRDLIEYRDKMKARGAA